MCICEDLLTNGGLISGSNGDVLLSPDQIPLDKINYKLLNFFNAFILTYI